MVSTDGFLKVVKALQWQTPTAFSGVVSAFRYVVGKNVEVVQAAWRGKGQ